MATPNFAIVRQRGGFVVCKDGEVCYGPNTQERAEQALERQERAARLKSRNCMTCHESFTSEGPQHRMCYRCRRHSFYDGSA